MAISAFYFDGKTSRKHVVTLRVEDDVAIVDGISSVAGVVERKCPLNDLRVSERVASTSRKVTFPDGAFLEITDNDAFNTLLANTGHQDSMVVRMQQSWSATVKVTIALILILVLGYVYVLPAASRIIANALPESIEHSIGSGALAFMDKQVLLPSQLPQQRRDAIVTRFKSLTTIQNADGEAVPDYQIVFRKSRIGPNAFALPSGQIVVTDEIVTLLNDDDALMGVLAHELGHLHQHHLMRRLVQTSTIAAVSTVLFGDVSALVANIPTVMLDLKYSRDTEEEADDYAVKMFKANGLSMQSLASVFEKLGNASKEFSSYLSTHPASHDRIVRILKAE
ncbi:M48 family metallopeptidase [Glaciimonas soli]|uniref:M48 family metalloprotease n=1 Tax=Glaciimonas soli TaxID=2590999 RepID=A0A843YT84_9BURK|nr:M48 family metallopeptidase [Glaciimonas soli]MQR02410.1 M48 family metalloprotease [Glaciimonas soli]